MEGGICDLEQTATTAPPDVETESRVMPLFHPGFSSTIVWSADRSKVSVSFSSCGGCARVVNVLTHTLKYAEGVSWTLDGGLPNNGRSQPWQDYRTVPSLIVLNPGPHVLNITNFPVVDDATGIEGLDHAMGGTVLVVDNVDGVCENTPNSTNATTESDCQAAAGMWLATTYIDDEGQNDWSTGSDSLSVNPFCDVSGPTWCAVSFELPSSCGCSDLTAQCQAILYWAYAIPVSKRLERQRPRRSVRHGIDRHSKRP